MKLKDNSTNKPFTTLTLTLIQVVQVLLSVWAKMEQRVCLTERDMTEHFNKRQYSTVPHGACHSDNGLVQLMQTICKNNYDTI